MEKITAIIPSFNEEHNIAGAIESCLFADEIIVVDSFSTDKTVEEINKIALDKGYVEKEDMLVNLTSMPIETKGMVNTLRVSVI